jgi:hypothetical protein
MGDQTLYQRHMGPLHESLPLHFMTNTSTNKPFCFLLPSYQNNISLTKPFPFAPCMPQTHPFFPCMLQTPLSLLHACLNIYFTHNNFTPCMLSSHNKAMSASLMINVLPGEVANPTTPGHTQSSVGAPSHPLLEIPVPRFPRTLFPTCSHQSQCTGFLPWHNWRFPLQLHNLPGTTSTYYPHLQSHLYMDGAHQTISKLAATMPAYVTTGKRKVVAEATGTITVTVVLDAGMPTTAARTVLKCRKLKALTPYKPDAWESLLCKAGLFATYHWIPDGLHYSFHLKLPQIKRTQTPPNKDSIIAYNEPVNTIIKGKYIGSFL